MSTPGHGKNAGPREIYCSVVPADSPVSFGQPVAFQ